MGTKIKTSLVKALTPGEIIYDDEIKGFVARRLPSGVITYGYRFRNDKAQSRWFSLGVHGSITPDEARGLAKQRAGEVASGRDPVAEMQLQRSVAKKTKLAEKNTVDAVLTAYVAAHVRTLRSSYQIKRAFDVYVRPRIGSKSIYNLKKSDIQSMLDEIRSANGPVMGDRVLAHVRAAFNWQADRDEEFRPPVVRARKKTEAERGGRTRVLTDDEIRSLWSALDSPAVIAPFPKIIRVLLLTGQRRTEVAGMAADEVNGDVWTIPAARYKTGVEHEVPLTEPVRVWIDPKKEGPIFPTVRGKKAFNDFSRPKRVLDNIIADQRKAAGLKQMPKWTLHDLRRTARSLLSRAGVSGDVGERVLGHIMPGVQGVYDRHRYATEKREALEKLAGLVALIINPPAENVVRLVQVRETA